MESVRTAAKDDAWLQQTNDDDPIAELESDELVHREVFAEVPPKVIYT